MRVCLEKGAGLQRTTGVEVSETCSTYTTELRIINTYKYAAQSQAFLSIVHIVKNGTVVRALARIILQWDVPNF